MPKIQYVSISFSEKRLAVVEQANAIIEEYEEQGYVLTLRQLYYQFVSRDLLGNRQQEYKRLGEIVNAGRLVGLIDWDSITDRTRNLETLPHWDAPEDIVGACVEQFRIDKWERQDRRVEVWIEKDALIGVIEAACRELDVPYFSCRGYTSQSELWRAGMRLRGYEDQGQETVVLHLGDHDPSGIDMTRDIRDRLSLFGAGTEVDRIALNMDQIREYGPPPNPAKTTDSRYEGYIREYGDESWELDALEPSVLDRLVRESVAARLDDAVWQEARDTEERGRGQLRDVADRWAEITL